MRDDRIAGAAQRHACDRCLRRAADRASRPTALRAWGPSSASSRSGPGKIDAVCPSAPTPSQTRSGGQSRSGQPRIGRLAGRAVVGRSRRPRSAGRARPWQEMAGNHRDIAQGVCRLRTRRSSVGMIVTRSQLIAAAASVRRSAIGDLPPGKRDQRLAARVERAFNDEADIAGDGIRHFVGLCHRSSHSASIMPAHSVAFGQADRRRRTPGARRIGLRASFDAMPSRRESRRSSPIAPPPRRGARTGSGLLR